MSKRVRVALWDAIHDFVRACGGEPTGTSNSRARMDAVVAVERAVDAEVADAEIAELHGQLGEWLNSGSLD